MVSFHKALAESPRTEVPAEFDASSKKRKWEEPFAEEFLKDQTNLEKRKSIFDIELHLETPLPSDKWRQYLSIQVYIMPNLLESHHAGICFGSHELISNLFSCSQGTYPCVTQGWIGKHKMTQREALNHLWVT